MSSQPVSSGLVTPSTLHSTSPEQDQLDTKVGNYIRSIISKEPGWDTFVKSRNRLLKISELIELQYKYVQDIFDRFMGKNTPEDLEGAGGVVITKAQVMKAFNLSLEWGKDCTETIVLTNMYGPNGKRCQDARIVQMLDEMPPISTGMHAKKYLGILREINSRWMIEHANL
ncbi:hypothetical protein C8Q75DRAFT_716645 [Abortiporus biennis]|nr:hypothetical protein C8Q75DRAFT_716645 [Abortiporus biennis]